MSLIDRFFSKKEVKIPKPETLELKDILAPSSISVHPNHIELDEKFSKTFFVFSYPFSLNVGWLSPVVNVSFPFDLSLFVHPVDTGTVLKKLRHEITQLEAEMMEREQKGLIRSPELELAYMSREKLRDKLVSAQEKIFYLGLYITIYANNEKELKDIEVSLRSIFEGRMVYLKPATYQQREGFISTTPFGLDKLGVHTAMNTAPLSTTFPFISFDLSSNTGIFYGINLHNNSLVIFDRFQLENANSCVFGVAGSGKSYFVKLEILRYLMLGVDIIVIDPEHEYKYLADTVGGTFLNISLSSPHRINPFDLPVPREDENPADVLRNNIVNLVGLLRLMLGGLTPEEDALIDTAITETYRARDITPESDPATWQENIPLLSDLQEVLETMEGTESIVTRLRKYTEGTYSGFFNQPTNINMENNFVVFGIRDMEEQLRPLAIYLIMRYIWKNITRELKKRILAIDEAWWMLQSKEGGSFVFGLTKRARKYWLGVTTITQDVADFLRSEYGYAIVSNSALKVLMKQSSATIEEVQKAFNLTQAEKMFLLDCGVGEGLFFAGDKHVMISAQASYTEDQIITTSPEQILKIKRAKEESP